MPERSLEPSVSMWAIRAFARLTATYAILQGLGIDAGGAGRWGSKGLSVALSIPGAPQSWGHTLIALGTLLLVSTFTRWNVVVVLSVWMLAALNFFFSITLVRPVIEKGSKVATTGPGTYLYVGIVALLIGVAYWQSRHVLNASREQTDAEKAGSRGLFD